MSVNTVGRTMLQRTKIGYLSVHAFHCPYIGHLAIKIIVLSQKDNNLAE